FVVQAEIQDGRADRAQGGAGRHQEGRHHLEIRPGRRHRQGQDRQGRARSRPQRQNETLVSIMAKKSKKNGKASANKASAGKASASKSVAKKNGYSELTFHGWRRE